MIPTERPSTDRRLAPRALAGASLALAVVFLALHLPYLPASLEDLDSINFALGMRRYDIAHHQPHPPGYPLFIAAARIAHRLIHPEAKALALVSVASGAIGVLALVWLFRELQREEKAGAPLVAAALALSSPLYWIMSARPLSDAMGLAAALAVQAMTLAARSDSGLRAAALCAGLAGGVRSQALGLTVPLVVYRCWAGARDRASADAARPLSEAARDAKPAILEDSTFASGAIACAAAFGAGVALWLVPAVVLTGGSAAYWHTLFDQGAEDLTGIRMLWTTRTPRALADALYFAFVAPWAVWPTAIVVLTLAAVGLASAWRRSRRALVVALVAFAPYIVFDLLFHEIITVRYALPIVVPMAWLAAAGLRVLPPPIAMVVGVAIVMFDAHVGGRTIASLSREPAPIFRALNGMRRAVAVSREAPILAPDRRLSFDLRRPVVWLGPSAPAVVGQLPAPPQHEWLEAVKYWNGGGRAPVWFLVDPRRAAIGLVQHGDPFAYRWTLPYPILMSGTRPYDLDWYPVDRPEWYVGEGWSLTPESAGVAEADRRGLAFGPIEAHVRSDVAGGTIVLGGRNFDPAARPRLTAAVAGRTIADFVAAPGPFLTLQPLPSDLAVKSDYLPLVVTATPPARVGIEQFDASSTGGVFGFGSGWHETELNPATGQQWRWLSDRGELRYVMPVSGILRIAGESPRKYYSRDSRIVVRAGDAILGDAMISSDFTIDVEIPVAREPSTLIVETDQTHVPAERGWRRTADRRILGLRIFTCEIRPRR